ncbi:MAG: hypothetical protein M3N33_05715 [Actinomycetota bacterium]|nr:hypothetical protein [Actinomycetota bacterium]
MIGQLRSQNAQDVRNTGAQATSVPEDAAALADDVNIAARRATMFVLPLTALTSTVLLQLVLENVFPQEYADFSGDLAVVVGVLLAVFVWRWSARFYRRYVTAASASRRNYNGLRERLSQLQHRVHHFDPRRENQTGVPAARRQVRLNAHAYAREQCERIEEGLRGRGTPWTTGLGYIELWHRVHRAEEALIKVEPHTEVLAGAMRDESRLANATMQNRDSLLKRLRCAVDVLDDSGTDNCLSYIEEPEERSRVPKERATAEDRAKALGILSEVRYEINNFRDNVWEGIVHARNRLAETSVVLGIAAYALLGLAVFANTPNRMIVWVVTYFLVGAIIGLFARAQGEWSANTAVDDFGLSTARLIHTPWLSGLAAVGGVLVTSILDSQLLNETSGASTLADIFKERPSLLIVAAIFGLTPDLIIRRLTQQVDKYKEDLQSTQSSQSAEDVPATEGAQRRQVRRQAG